MAVLCALDQASNMASMAWENEVLQYQPLPIILRVDEGSRRCPDPPPSLLDNGFLSESSGLEKRKHLNFTRGRQGVLSIGIRQRKQRIIRRSRSRSLHLSFLFSLMIVLQPTPLPLTCLVSRDKSYGTAYHQSQISLTGLNRRSR